MNGFGDGCEVRGDATDPENDADCQIQPEGVSKVILVRHRHVVALRSIAAENGYSGNIQQRWKIKKKIPVTFNSAGR